MNIRDLYSSRLSANRAGSSGSDKLLIIIGSLLVMLAIAFYAFDLGILLPPSFEGEIVVVIPRGFSADDIATILFEKGLIRSRSDFLLYLKLIRKEGSLRSGRFVFSQPLSVVGIVSYLQTPDTRSETVIIQEGWGREEIGVYFENHGFFSREKFLQASEGREGYLFPDTYRVFKDITAEEMATIMQENFQEKTERLTIMPDTIIMASLIEKEARDGEDRRIISGILWKRLKAGFPLQVDATLWYLTRKASHELGEEELNIDSPYNTYRVLGLPPTAITNPGRDAIEAALFPKESSYWYYLHDKNGIPHYARTFEEHKLNKARYLR